MLATFPPSYLYQGFKNDPDLQALVAAQNTYQQAFLDRQLGLNLPIYTGVGSLVSGALLDWVALGLYDMRRPVFGFLTGTSVVGGDYNTANYNTQDYNGSGISQTFSYQVATDDQFQRCITWNFYKGDGAQFTSRWLKRRVQRFLTGLNGTDPGIDQTYLVSVAWNSGNAVVITCDSSFGDIIDVLRQALAGGFLFVPFDYSFTVA